MSISPDESLRLELDGIVELGKTESTQNLIRNFFLAEKYKKGTSRTPPEKIVHAAVIGAGVMGSGIAQWLSSRGVTVILRDVAREQIDRGLANIEKIYADAVKRGLMSEEKAKQGRARICGSTAPMELRDVQFVIEATSEKMEIKKEVFRELAMEAGPKTHRRDKYFSASGQRTGRCDGFARARDRTAFLQSGEPDETGGSCYCEANIRRNARPEPGFCTADRKSAGNRAR